MHFHILVLSSLALGSVLYFYLLGMSYPLEHAAVLSDSEWPSSFPTPTESFSQTLVINIPSLQYLLGKIFGVFDSFLLFITTIQPLF